jgi:hypothetical protein
MDTKRVFVLGAGFSKQAGMPLAAQLTELLIKDFKVRGNKFLGKWFKNLGNRIEWLNKSSPERSWSLSVEEFFDFAPYDVLAYQMRALSSPSGACALYTQRAQEIQQALKQMEAYLWRVIIDTQKNVVANLDGITRFSKKLRPDDTVITFNYDTLLEYSLSHQNADWHYGFSSENGKGVPILKMHGSVNWLKVPPDGVEMTDSQRYRVLFQNQTDGGSTNVAGGPPTLPCCLVCHRECSPAKLHKDARFAFQPSDDQRAIGGLGRYKPLDQLPGSWEVWVEAIRSLRQANEICVIGFSLSPFDVMARLHFAGVMCERAKKQTLPKRIVLVDPSACSLKANFQSVFGTGPPIGTVQEYAENVDWDQLLGR